MTCAVVNHVPCSGGCGGEVVAGRYLDLQLPKLHPDGRQVVTRDGELLFITIPLPFHVNDLTHSVQDPTGFVPALCEHGLAEHPDPDIQASRLGGLGRSWIRSKYVLCGLGITGRCVVCQGEPRPADLTEARA